MNSSFITSRPGNDGNSSPSSLLNEENLENLYMVFPLQKNSSSAKMI